MRTLTAVLVLSLGAVAPEASGQAIDELAGAAGPAAQADAEAVKESLSRLRKETRFRDRFLERHRSAADRMQAMAHVHAPIRQGWCSICHASPEDPSLMAEDSFLLCRACHDPGKEPLRKAHQGVTEIEGPCTACHDPHASAEPGLPREKGRHMPYAEKMCGMCHSEPLADGKPGVKDPVSEACSMCHSRTVEEGLGRKAPHAAFALGRCAGCHDPHVSRRRALLRSRPEDFCRKCHERIPDRPHPVTGPAGGHPSFSRGPVRYGPPGERFDCLSCHQAHGGDQQGLLTAPPGSFCSTCHPM
ncbi:MAG: hypothetical protein HY924_07160 [Elusimicrobia bacterium]|nr:hypothetical protein [Elusimicrobiota bacterium]